MFADSVDDWNVGEISGRVSIGSHKLWLSAHGPDRKPGEPLVIIIPGLARYGESDCSTEKPTASNIAKELDLLLRNANMPPPYVIIAHSWGGILSREFLSLHPKDIFGMLFVEANQERTLEVLDWRQLAMSALLIGVNNVEVTGISHTRKLTSDEWRIYQDTEGTEQHWRQANLEFAEYPNSFPVLASKSQLHREIPFLGDHPVCVIKGNNRADFEKLLNAGLARGNGDDAKEAAFREILDTWDAKDRSLQSEILLLSTKSRYIETENSGHNVHLAEPQLIVEGIRWILSQARRM